MELHLDDGIQFGLGLFETIAVENGHPLLLEWHLERLQHSMQFLGITRKVDSAEILEALANQETTHHALKLTITERNTIFSLRKNLYTEERFRRGFQMEFSPVRRNESSPLVLHKTMNYGDNILENRRAKSLGLDEVIFLNSKGEICEGTVSNIFFAKDGVLYTPPVTCGLLPGIMRRWMMQQYPVIERVLYPEDTVEMECCFVTNSLMGIMPVRRLGEIEFSEKSFVKEIGLSGLLK